MAAAAGSAAATAAFFHTYPDPPVQKAPETKKLLAYFSYNPLVDGAESKKILGQLRQYMDVIDPFELVPIGSKGDTPDNVRDRCYEAIRGCRILVAHIPRPYFYVGLIAEMEHARGRKISVYTISADQKIREKTWIQGLSDGVASDVDGLLSLLKAEGLVDL
jgi:hypothetical protein